MTIESAKSAQQLIDEKASMAVAYIRAAGFGTHPGDDGFSHEVDVTDMEAVKKFAIDRIGAEALQDAIADAKANSPKFDAGVLFGWVMHILDDEFDDCELVWWGGVTELLDSDEEGFPGEVRAAFRKEINTGTGSDPIEDTLVAKFLDTYDSIIVSDDE